MKFEVGDRVRVKKKSECSGLEIMPNWIKEMDKLQGKELEVLSVGLYPMAGGWKWREDWLEPVHKTNPRVD